MTFTVTVTADPGAFTPAVARAVTEHLVGVSVAFGGTARMPLARKVSPDKSTLTITALPE